METRTFAILYFVIFIVAMVALALYTMRQKQKSGGDAATEQFLGGKNIPFAVLAISYGASSASSGAFMGDPAVISYTGYPYMWMMISCMVGFLLITLLIVRKMRLQCERLGVLSPVEYVAVRYDSKFLCGLMGIVCAVCFLVSIVAQFKAASVLLNHFSGLDFNLVLVVVAVVVLMCTVIGGLRSVAWTDAVQGLVMAVMCVVTCVLGIVKAGGFSHIDEFFGKMNPESLQLAQNDMWADYGVIGIIGVFLFGIVILPAQPYLTSRYMALKGLNRKLIGKYAIVLVVFSSIFLLNFFSGLSGRVLFPDAEADYIVVSLVTGIMPPVFSCIMMIGLFAAILTTSTSMLLTVGQSIGRDFLGVVMPSIDDRKQVIVSNCTCVVVVVLAVFFNMVYTPKVLTLVNLIGLTGVGAALAMPLYMGVLYKKATKEAAVGSCLVGIAATILFNTVWLKFGYGVSYGGPIVFAAIAFFVINAIVLRTKGLDPKIEALGDINSDISAAV